MIHHRARNGLTYIDLLVTLLLVLLTIAAAAPAVTASRELQLRVQCAANLRQIGMGMMLYANDNKGAYPRVRFDWADGAPLNYYTGVDSDDPFAKEGAPLPNDVTAALYLLVRNADLAPRTFLCPRVMYARLDDPGRARADRSIDAAFENAGKAQRARRQYRIDADWVEDPAWAAKPLERSNFAGPQDLHYSIALMYPPAKAIAKGYKFHSGVVADLAAVADINPGHADLLKATHTRGALANILRNVNSPNHAGEGQNVMANDGSVRWFINPFAGAERDNIYTHGRTSRTSGGIGIAGPPDWNLDSVLLPTADQQPTQKREGAK